MDTQQAYDQIRRHFNAPYAQLAKMGGKGSSCAYRTNSGDKCAVGALIPDEKYTAEMEGSDLCGLWLARFPFVDGLLHNVDKRFLRSAQVLHDSVAEDAAAFVRGLDLLATLFGLTTQPGGFAAEEYLQGPAV